MSISIYDMVCDHVRADRFFAVRDNLSVLGALGPAHDIDSGEGHTALGWAFTVPGQGTIYIVADLDGETVDSWGMWSPERPHRSLGARDLFEVVHRLRREARGLRALPPGETCDAITPAVRWVGPIPDGPAVEPRQEEPFGHPGGPAPLLGGYAPVPAGGRYYTAHTSSTLLYREDSGAWWVAAPIWRDAYRVHAVLGDARREGLNPEAIQGPTARERDPQAWERGAPVAEEGGGEVAYRPW